MECKEENCKGIFSMCKRCTKYLIASAEHDERKRILRLIDKDIELQKMNLGKSFEDNKPGNWRITGMEYLKKNIKETQ